jgi:ABC-type glycerol-3-phosphate transport system substrate-binding protein
VLKRVRDLLVAAKPKWRSMDYGMTEKMSNNDVPASVNWNGSTMRVRANNPAVVYGYPREGYPVWMDSIGILSDAKNVDEAYKFLDFVMVPENAAMISSFARYANGISGSDAFMPEEMKTAPEIVVRALGAPLLICIEDFCCFAHAAATPHTQPGLGIGKGAELDHGAMPPQGVLRGQNQKHRPFAGGLVKR